MKPTLETERLVLRPQCSGSKSTYVSDKQGDL